MIYRFSFKYMMNHSVLNWNMENNLPPSDTQKRSMGPDSDLVELLWRNGQLVQQSQIHRKSAVPAVPTHDELVQKKKLDHSIKDGEAFMNFRNLIEEDETAAWMQFPLDDSLGGDFCSNFFYELSNSHPIEKEKPIKQFGASEVSDVLPTNTTQKMQQPTFRQPINPNYVENSPRLHNVNLSHDPSFGGPDRIENFPHFSRPIKAEINSLVAPVRGSGSVVLNGGDIAESSVMTIGSSHCGSNQLQNEVDRSRVSSNGIGSTGIKASVRKCLSQSERGLSETLETNITSSSGGSGGSYAGTDKQSISKGHKRKGRDADESECQSEDPDFESAGAAKKAPQRSGSTRRSRAAEVHNLSERRRRDRINEKMRALQELIPHCNKSDKASMLDEAIEYLKSLQLQVQMMWMGSGMGSMMFPGVQHYIPRMGMAMGTHHSVPSISSPIQLPRVPLVDQTMSSVPLSNQPTICPSVLSGINFQNRMQSPDFSQPYARHMNFHHMQAPQAMNMYGFGSQIAQHNSKVGLPTNGTAPMAGGVLTDDTPSSKLG